MANVFTKQTIQDGPRNVVIHAYLSSDGVAGDLSDSILVDASSLNGSPSDLRVMCIHSSLTGFNAKLSFDATANVPFLELVDGENEHDFKDHGGIPNNAGAGKTGDILISTNGFDASGDDGHITIHLKKKG